MSDEPQLPDESGAESDLPDQPTVPNMIPDVPETGVPAFRIVRVQFGFLPPPDVDFRPDAPVKIPTFSEAYSQLVRGSRKVEGRFESGAIPQDEVEEPTPSHYVHARVFHRDSPHPVHGRVALHASVLELKQLAMGRFDSFNANPYQIFTLRGIVAGNVPGATKYVELDQMGSLFDAWQRMREKMPQPARWTGTLAFDLTDDGSVMMSDGTARTRAEWMQLIRDGAYLATPASAS